MGRREGVRILEAGFTLLLCCKGGLGFCPPTARGLGGGSHVSLDAAMSVVQAQRPTAAYSQREANDGPLWKAMFQQEQGEEGGFVFDEEGDAEPSHWTSVDPSGKGPYGRQSRGRRRKIPLENTHYLQQHGLQFDQLLTKNEEYELGMAAKRWLPIEQARKDMVEELGRHPSTEEWAMGVGLSPEELECEMVVGKRAVQRLVRSNIRLVLSVAKKYRSEFVDYSDLIQEGTLGLLRAVQKFDPHRGFKFGTYATWWIQQGMLRCLSNDSRVVRIPVHVQALYSKYKKLRQKLEYERGEAVSDEELATMLNISLKRLQQHLSLCKPQRSFEEKLGGVSLSGDALYFYDVYADTQAQQDAEKNFAQSHLRNTVGKALRCLSAEERQFLRMRYGLDDGKAKTTREIAEYSQVTIEYVRRTTLKALQRLRSADTYRLLQSYMSGPQSWKDELLPGEGGADPWAQQGVSGSGVKGVSGDAVGTPRRRRSPSRTRRRVEPQFPLFLEALPPRMGNTTLVTA